MTKFKKCQNDDCRRTCGNNGVVCNVYCENLCCRSDVRLCRDCYDMVTEHPQEVSVRGKKLKLGDWKSKLDMIEDARMGVKPSGKLKVRIECGGIRITR